MEQQEIDGDSFENVAEEAQNKEESLVDVMPDFDVKVSKIGRHFKLNECKLTNFKLPQDNIT